VQLCICGGVSRCLVGRLKWSERNPDYLKPDGTPVYDRRARVRIWSEKLKAEYFSTRKPSRVQRVQIAAAVCLILEISAAHESFQAGGSLPRSYLAQFNTLQRLLDSFRPKAPKGKVVKDSGPSLAAILGGEA